MHVICDGLGLGHTAVDPSSALLDFATPKNANQLVQRHGLELSKKKTKKKKKSAMNYDIHPTSVDSAIGTHLHPFVVRFVRE